MTYGIYDILAKLYCKSLSKYGIIWQIKFMGGKYYGTYNL
nr:MAG TPA_asm: hypothetical protein [Caudoviricetes sp.]DAZ61711.1 MAG TPA: hypothetical protein [Caudoviricetes sp.]